MRICRPLTCKLKVSTQEQWEWLLYASKSGTAATNFAAKIINENEQAQIVEKLNGFNEWKLQNRKEAEEYEKKFSEYEKNLEEISQCKKQNLPIPKKLKPPKNPYKHKYSQKLCDFTEIRKSWQKERLISSITINDNTKKITSVSYLLSEGENIRKVAEGVKSALAHRKNGHNASIPQPKPEYVNTQIKFYKPSFTVKKQDNQYSVTIGAKGTKTGYLVFRFFPNKDLDIETVTGITILKTIGEKGWKIILMRRIESSNEPLPQRTIGVDINCGPNNTLVIADRQGEIKRLSLPIQKLKDIQTKINILNTKKDTILNINGKNYQSNQCKKLRKQIRRLYEHARNIRSNNLHQFSKEIVRMGNVISLEDLDIKKMTTSPKNTPNLDTSAQQKSKLNTMVLNVAPGKFRDLIISKSDALNNSKVVLINPAFSSQKCCHCGQIGNRDGINFTCTNKYCFSYDIIRDADANAAVNHVKEAETGKYQPNPKPNDTTKIEDINNKRILNNLKKQQLQTIT